jgi:hypothetical protein
MWMLGTKECYKNYGAYLYIGKYKDFQISYQKQMTLRKNWWDHFKQVQYSGWNYEQKG